MLHQVIDTIHRTIWGLPMLLFVLAVSILLTIALRGLQIRKLIYALKIAFFGYDSKLEHSSEGDIGHFQSLMTSLAAIIGIGNIVGVATAISSGGLGALFWMWITALFGMAATYGESLLAIKFRCKDKRGEMSGGPMYYIEKGLKMKWLAVMFAVGGCLATITTGNMIQANSITDALSHSYGINVFGASIVISILVGIMIIKGIKVIGVITGILVPIMALFYILGGSVIILLNYTSVPGALSTIFTSAFTGQAAAGGFLGSTMIMALRFGVTRGILVCEAGMGTTSIAAAAARTDTPGRQALISMTGSFLSTFIICTITGLVLAVTGVIGEVGANGKLLSGVALAIEAFNRSLPMGGLFVNIGAVLFGLSTIISWAYYGEKCFEYLFSEKIIIVFRIIFALTIILGCNLELEIVWSLSDIATSIMVLPNLIGLVGLLPVIIKETNKFLKIIDEERLAKKK